MRESPESRVFSPQGTRKGARRPCCRTAGYNVGVWYWRGGQWLYPPGPIIPIFRWFFPIIVFDSRTEVYVRKRFPGQRYTLETGYNHRVDRHSCKLAAEPPTQGHDPGSAGPFESPGNPCNCPLSNQLFCGTNPLIRPFPGIRAGWENHMGVKEYRQARFLPIPIFLFRQKRGWY